MAEVFTLYSYEISDNWHLIEPFLRRVEAPDWTLEGVKAELESARSQLWGAADEQRIRGVWITRLETFFDTKFGLVWIAAGDPLEAGLELYRKHTEPWFKAQGCAFVQIVGRAGWLKALPDYRETARIFRKELS